MKYILALILCFAFTGCDVAIDLGSSKPATVEYPTVNLPISLRQSNWLGNKNEGSCVYATAVMLFRWQGRHAMADHIRATYGNGEWADDTWNPQSNLADKLDALGVRHAYTTSGDVAFLEWACSTRRGCGVTVQGGQHMVMLAHFDNEWAGICDNNDPNKIIWVPRDQFVVEWQSSNGWAWTPIYTPTAPLPN